MDVWAGGTAGCCKVRWVTVVKLLFDTLYNVHMLHSWAVVIGGMLKCYLECFFQWDFCLFEIWSKFSNFSIKYRLKWVACMLCLCRIVCQISLHCCSVIFINYQLMKQQTVPMQSVILRASSLLQQTTVHLQLLMELYIGHPWCKINAVLMSVELRHPILLYAMTVHHSTALIIDLAVLVFLLLCRRLLVRYKVQYWPVQICWLIMYTR